jgi:hypothetical protein
MSIDLGSTCFGDANIGPLCFLSILSWILLSWVEMLLKNNSDLEIGCVDVCPLLLDFCSGCGLRVCGYLSFTGLPERLLGFSSSSALPSPCSLSSLLCDSEIGTLPSSPIFPTPNEKREAFPFSLFAANLLLCMLDHTAKVVIVRSERRNHGRLYVVMSR